MSFKDIDKEGHKWTRDIYKYSCDIQFQLIKNVFLCYLISVRKNVPNIGLIYAAYPRFKQKRLKCDFV